MEVIAAGVTQSIIKRYDSAKVRPPPKTSRSERALAGAKIVLEYQRIAASGTPPSYRDLADITGRSKSTVARVLKQVGIASGNAPAVLHGLNADAFAVLETLVPHTSRRIVDIEEILDVLGKGSDQVDEIIGAAEEISQGSVDMQVIVIDDKTLFVSRGRRSSPESARAWVEQAREAKALQRNTYIKSPVKFATPTSRNALVPVARDLMSVTALLQDPNSIDAWKDFIAAVVVVGVPDPDDTLSTLKLDDHKALFKILDATRRFDGTLRDRLPKVASWFPDKNVWRVMKVVLTLQQKISDIVQDRHDEDLALAWERASIFGEAVTFRAYEPALETLAIKTFLELTGYVQKVKSGRLPGRRLGDIEQVLSTFEMAFFDSRPPQEVIAHDLSRGAGNRVRP